MKPSNVCFTVAGTIIAMHQMLFDTLGGFDTGVHNAMTGKAALLSYALAAGAVVVGWRMRKGEHDNS